MTINRCPECLSTQIYFRIKSKLFACQKCGNQFLKDEMKKDEIVEREVKKELNLDAKNGKDICK